MINILYKDKYIAVCVKPSGMLSEGGKDSLPAALSEELSSGGAPATLFPVHRLDRDTEGIMVYARTEKAAALLSEAIAAHRFEKEYIARVCGVPQPPRGIMEDLLFYDRQRGKSFVVQRERKGVKKAALTYELISYDKDSNTSLVKILLGTGRTHQIRVQFASRGMPLVGDRRYGAPAADVATPSLIAHRLAFDHPKTGERMEFEIN